MRDSSPGESKTSGPAARTTGPDETSGRLSPSSASSLSQPHPHFNPLLKAEEVARILGVSKTQAYRLMASELPCIRFGGNTVRVRLSDLEAYLAAHRHDHGGAHE